MIGNATRFGCLLVAAFGAAAAATAALADDAIDTSMNIVENPSFELHAPIRRNRSAVFTAIPGWRSSLEHIQIHEGNSGGIGAFDGRSKLGLDGLFNSGVFQELDTLPGRRYRLELFYAPQSKHHRHDTNDFSVEWNGEPIQRIGGERRYWRRHLFDLQATSDLSTLLLRGEGRSDRVGALIDALTLNPSAYASANLIVNGSFEMPDNFGHSSRKLFTSTPGWTVQRGTIELIRHGTAGVLPYEGRTLLALDGRYQDKLKQTLTLSPGKSYDLELFFSPERSSWKDRVQVLVDGEVLDSVDGRDKVWHRRRWSIVAGGEEVELTLRVPRADHGHSHGHGHGHSHNHNHNHNHNQGHGGHDDDDDGDYGQSGHGSNKGGLIDNVRLHLACRASDNQVVNHSFENYGHLRYHDRGTFLTVPGWRAAQGHIEIHRYGGHRRSLMAAEGHSHIELGGHGNIAVVQDIVTEPGARYELLFAYSPRVEVSGTGQNDVEVSWNGQVVKSVGGDRKGWQFHRVVVEATAEASELRFFGPNSRHGKGGQIDEVRLFRLDVPEFTSEPVADVANGEAYSYTPLTDGTASADVVFALNGAPEGMIVDEATGQITWPDAVEGEYSLELAAINACGDRVVQRFTLVVSGLSNQPPIIFSTPVTMTDLFTLRPVVSAEDANLGSLLIELNGVPVASGTRITQDGDYTLRVLAADRAGNTTERIIQFVIDRNAAP